MAGRRRTQLAACVRVGALLAVWQAAANVTATAQAAAPGSASAAASASPGAIAAAAPPGAPVLLLVSAAVAPYTATAAAVEAALRGGRGTRRVDLGGTPAAGVTALRALAPGAVGAILAVGPEAARACATAALALPVVYAQVLDPAASGITALRDAWGVSTALPASLALDRVRLHLPDVRRVGLVHEPGHGAAYAAGAAAEAKTRGLVLVSMPAATPKAVPDAWRAARGKIDALWLPPLADPVVYDEAARRFLLDGALRDRLPVLAHFPFLRARGPVLSVETVPDAVGAQAAALAARLAAGERPAARLVAPERAAVYVMAGLADRLGVRVLGGGGATVVRP
ncbi:MAG TPA: ABC transporter substrate binding protein [Myxococcota bacterium]|nr:ABC transporter substrate binding protein [Myxococcota bacterium]